MMKGVVPNRKSRQRGVVLIFALIILLILAIGAVALVRSMNSSLLSAGNLAFRRDLVNQGEQAVSYVMTEFKTQSAPLLGITTVSLPAANYSAVTLPTNVQGVPNALLNEATFLTVGVDANDIIGATSDVKIRYVIDRLCVIGTVQPTINACVQSSGNPLGGKAYENTAVAAPSSTVYRISVRVSGPRNTQVFLQTTFTKPD
jgi:type IV pilus assembly protein PilX